MVEDKHTWKILQPLIGEDCLGLTGTLELEQSQNQKFGHNYKEFMWKIAVGKATVISVLPHCTSTVSASPLVSAFMNQASGVGRGEISQPR